MFQNTLYMVDIDVLVLAILNGSILSLNYGTMIWFAPQETTRILKLKRFYNESSGSMVRTHPYAHPYHRGFETPCMCLALICKAS